MPFPADHVDVDFGQPFPLFPLDRVSLLPCAVVPLYIYEPRYAQLLQHALDGRGMMAMAVLDKSGWCCETFGDPPVRRAVCVGRVVQHEREPDGRYHILLQGVCRARIADHTPASGSTLYRRAQLRPIEIPDDDELPAVRTELMELFQSSALSGLAAAESVAGALRSPEAPVKALLDLIGMSAISDPDTRYRLLDDGRADRRAGVLLGELGRLRDSLQRAQAQRAIQADQPKGVWLN